MSKAEDKRKNCQSCNKSLKRVDWYFRNGSHFCNKNCFKAHAKKAQEQS